MRHLIVVSMIRYVVQGLRRPDVAIPFEEVEPDYAPTDVEQVLKSPPLDVDFSIFRHFRDSSETILDVGANIGLAAASIWNSGCRAAIISFEPNPWHHAALQRIKERMPGRFDFMPIGLGEADRKVRFVTPVVEGRAISTLATADIESELDWGIPENLVIHCMQVIPHVATPRIQFCEAEWAVVTLDAAIANARLDVPLDRIVAIKLDVQGYEAKTLAGGRNLLARYRPLIMIEGANRVPQVDQLLSNLGYFFADYEDGRLVKKDTMSMRTNGFYLHRTRLEEYMASGLLAPI